MLSLRPYQEQALEAITEAEARGVRRQLVAHPTGTGKTVTFAHLIHQQREVGWALVLCHRDELIQQTLDKLGIIAPELDVGVVKAERNELGHPITVASVQTLSRPNRLSQLARYFTLVIVDEAHHAVAETWKRVLEHVGSFMPGGPLVVGWTATPARADGGLGDVWQEVVHSLGILPAIIDGYLCDLRGQTVGTDADLTSVRKVRGDYAANDLGTELERGKTLEQISQAYWQYAGHRKGIAFTPTVETARGLAHELKRHGIEAEVVWGGMALEDRRGVLRRLRTGETQVVTNCAVLTEGFDEPSVDCIVIARPTRSHPLYVQMVGRGTRTHPGKTDCLVLDVTGASEDHSLVCLADLSPSPLKRKQVEETTLAEAYLEAEARDPNGIRRAARTKAVDLFKASRMKWLRIPGGLCLPAGQATVIIAPDGDDWKVIEQRPGNKAVKDRLSIVATGLSIDYACGYGEDLARREGKTVANRNARWRKETPTRPQIGYLRSLGMSKDTVATVTTRGQAADLITGIKARSALRRLEKRKESV